jgi:hypothetical protein
MDPKWVPRWPDSTFTPQPHAPNPSSWVGSLPGRHCTISVTTPSTRNTGHHYSLYSFGGVIYWDFFLLFISVGVGLDRAFILGGSAAPLHLCSIPWAIGVFVWVCFWDWETFGYLAVFIGVILYRILGWVSGWDTIAVCGTLYSSRAVPAAAKFE